MVVGIKDALKLVIISIIVCCAVLVCTMFLNFNMDIATIKDRITLDTVMAFYDAQISVAKLISIVSGGCLLITSLVMIVFYIKNYINIHKKELGILKALGYSNFKIATNFWVFGISVFAGAIAGFCMAFIIMPLFYETQNKDKILPEISVHFHIELFLAFVILPTVGFIVVSILFAYFKLKEPVLFLLKDNFQTSLKFRNQKKEKYKADKEKDCSFTDDLKHNILKGRKSLVFFIIFASFCFSSMTQMSFSMDDIADKMFAVMLMLIGLVLSFTVLFLSITTVVNSNTKTIAMMRVFGYSQKECCNAVLGEYRLLSYIGFVIGTIYQYVLLRITMDIVFKNVSNIPEYKFDVPIMFVSFILFVIIYEIIMYFYSERIKRISIKEIMIEY